MMTMPTNVIVSTRDSLVPSMCILRYVSAMSKRFETQFGRTPIRLLSFPLAHGGFNLPDEAGTRASNAILDHMYQRELGIVNGEEETGILDLETAANPDDSLFSGVPSAPTVASQRSM